MGEQLIAFGRVIKPHGIRGAFIVECSADQTHLMSPGVTIHLERDEDFAGSAKGTPPATLAFATASEHQGRYLVTCKEVRDRNDVDFIRGCIMLVPRNKLAALEEGEIILSDLINARARWNGADVGVVKDVAILPANAVLEVVLESTEHLIKRQTVFVPFITDAVPELDDDNRSWINVDLDFLGVEHGG